MEVTIVTTTAERDEMKSTLDGYAKMTDGEITKDEFRRDYPNKIWIDTELCKSHDAGLPFMVVDNRDGECFCEDFVTLDGAILYATDVYHRRTRRGLLDSCVPRKGRNREARSAVRGDGRSAAVVLKEVAPQRRPQGVSPGGVRDGRLPEGREGVLPCREVRAILGKAAPARVQAEEKVKEIEG